MEEYDTADGWHVRKYANGVAEMNLSVQLNGKLINNPWGSLYYGRINEQYTYPVPLLKVIDFDVKASGNGAFSAIPLGMLPLTATPLIDLITGVSSTYNMIVRIKVVGKYK